MAATNPSIPLPMTANALNRSGLGSAGQKNLLMLGIGFALLVALISAAVMWGKTPDYKVLYSNLSDKDGGAILAQLSQMNIPYKNADGGGAIMVPSDQVHEARLKLASQGLPKGGTVGFELLENQRFGATQFQEQVNFQRGLEGELAKSIQSLSSVQSARVHLALPKQSAFLREQQKPSASVILNLYPGRTLDRAQVAGIVHLVSSSVPDLPMKNVTTLDQHGTLLSSVGNANNAGGLDPDKLNYIQQLEQGYIRRVTDLLEPIVGRNNVRAQVTADVDFAVFEQTAETFKPNIGEASVRSSAVNESNAGSGAGAQGVPGALSNQPPANPTAPLQGASSAPTSSATSQGSAPAKRELTTNYELDKVVRVEKRPVGAVKRLSAAVVVNNNRVVDKDGKVTMQPLSEADLTKITSLVREAVGFSQTRGDTLNVVNVPFNVDEKIVETETPLWKQPDNISLAKETGKGLALLIGLLVLVFSVIRPALRSIGTRNGQIPSVDYAGDPALAGPDAVYTPGRPAQRLSAAGSAAQLAEVRQLAKQDPATVANVVRTWVSKDG